MKGVFIVGTDTGIGKTLVSTALVRRWSEQGKRVAAMKPCETGDGDDATQLRVATGRALEPTLVNPYRFRLAAAPAIAAAAEESAIQLERIQSAARSLAADAERVVVEGAGGLLVPFTKTQTCADLVALLGLPVLLVARTALGTMNHTLLTLEALRARRLPVLGVVFSRSGDEGPEEAASLALTVQLGAVEQLGLVPRLSGSLVERQRQCADHLAADRIFTLCS